MAQTDETARRKVSAGPCCGQIRPGRAAHGWYAASVLHVAAHCLTNLDDDKPVPQG
jgi:hypothetical protein